MPYEGAASEGLNLHIEAISLPQLIGLGKVSYLSPQTKNSHQEISPRTLNRFSLQLSFSTLALLPVSSCPF